MEIRSLGFVLPSIESNFLKKVIIIKTQFLKMFMSETFFCHSRAGGNSVCPAKYTGFPPARE